MSRILLKAMGRMRIACARFPGQGSIEWTLIVALIGLFLVAGLVSLQGVMEGKLDELGDFIRDV